MPRLIVLLAVWLGAVVSAHSQQALHQRIDQLILAQRGDHAPAVLCDDATFLRRVCLDFADRLPTPSEIQAFLADKADDKRQRWIDRLLKSEGYVQRMQRWFHVMLMERRGDDPNWQTFLGDSFKNNRPWDQMVRHMLKPQVANEATKGSAFFMTKRLEKYGQNPTDYPGLTRDTARLFLGQDLQCAQCHDHLFIRDYRQVDFQGLYTVFLNVAIDRKTKFPAVSEKPITKKLQFVSVFDPTQKQTAPRLPTGKEASFPPTPQSESKDVATKDKDDKKKGQPPSIQGLDWLGRELPTAENKLFSRNIANRLWAMMMGRGLVHPLDLQHSENPPSHPELLQLLADEFVSHQFDIQWFLRELALSETYQRATAHDGVLPPENLFLVARQRRIMPETLADNIVQSLGPWPTSGVAAEKTGEKAEQKKTKSEEDQKKESETAVPLDEFRKSLIEALANPPREPEVDIRSTVKGALFLSNSDLFLELLKPVPGNLVDRLAQMKDPRRLSDELYLSVLSRLPNDDERRLVREFLAGHPKDRTKAIGHLVWAAACSMEFYVNH